jgi:hypothetical protein
MCGVVALEDGKRIRKIRRYDRSSLARGERDDEIDDGWEHSFAAFAPFFCSFSASFEKKTTTQTSIYQQG